MRIQFLSPSVGPAGDLDAISLPAGETRGVVIDNPSGSWVQLFPTFDWIAPYTLGYTRTLPNAAASVSVRYQTLGPSGQISTQAGDPIRVWLDTGDVGNAPGIMSGAPFIEQFTPILSARLLRSLISTGPNGSVAIVAGVPNQRIRLYTVTVQLGQPDFGNSIMGDSDAGITIEDNTPAFYIDLAVSRDMPTSSVEFAGGLDFPIGLAVLVGGFAAWADVNVITAVTYSVI